MTLAIDTVPTAPTMPRGATEAVSERARIQRRRGLLLSAPAVGVMALVTAYPLAYALLLSVQRYDLRFPDERAFVGPSNYATVLTSAAWWQALGTTLLVTVVSVAGGLIVAFGIATVLHRAVAGRRLVQASLLVPYAMAAVVAALAWRQAFDLATAWSSNRATAMAMIIVTEMWRTTPFLALLLLMGMALVPPELEKAARVDGANAWQRFWHVRLPLMRSVVLVAVLFRTLDAFRIFDTIYVQTGGAQDTESVSVMGFRMVVDQLNLGMGSTVSVLLFLCAAGIAALFVRRFGRSLTTTTTAFGAEGER